MENNKNANWNDVKWDPDCLKPLEIIITNRLKTKKFYFLNDLYKLIGLPEDANRERAGWFYNNETGDYEFADDIYNYIYEFDVYECEQLLVYDVDELHSISTNIINESAPEFKLGGKR